MGMSFSTYNLDSEMVILIANIRFWWPQYSQRLSRRSGMDDVKSKDIKLSYCWLYQFSMQLIAALVFAILY